MEQRIPARGELDIATAPELRRALDQAIEADPDGSILVDFSAVGFADATGLDVLVAAQRRAGARGGRLFLVNPSPSVRRVLQFTGLDEVLLAPDAMHAC